MTTTSVGRAVELAVAKHLEKKGYKLVEQNWRTKWCEIDLVMKKDGVVYFVEVKFRRQSTQGAGIDYITPKKLEQMRRAALSWVTVNRFDGDYRLMAAEVDGVKSTIHTEELD